MKNETLGSIFLLTFITIVNLLQSCASAQARFDVLSLNITPQKITTAEKATIAVQIRNIETEVATCNVPLMVNGVADDRKNVTLAAGDTESIIFVVAKKRAGTYIISVGNKESTLVVEEPLPPEFRLSNLEINPTAVNSGENVVITAKIINTGGIKGSYTAELKINGAMEQRERLIIPAGTDYTLVFKISEDLPGTYIVTIGDLVGWYVVNEQFGPVINPPCPPSGGCAPGD
ncbi:MAG TPA: CARDB domain-containing protein [Dehalococcoidia bacterium]